ncbi:DUF2087 domain-containing protein [Ornithinimicrobium pratense]|uniref:DUF2087 domain-containing protein n=1 Tax=Ornithinimicrobium pratense TaxID=2593973 RepID=A0A5J6V4A3_9MICO|nr:DUF2087 domain-containing protein [Ornithinimicrobium pratense]QFG68114.1 DUF2087 domain-containing protein [Ornithinimicrobium pratense]
MTRDADFKARVRGRMERTGENYTTAREAVLAEPPPSRPAGGRADVDPPPSRTVAPSVDLTSDPAADKAVRSFFDGDRLRSIPTKRRARAAVLMYLLLRFERGRDYPEREVNEILRTAHPDISTLRRELVDYRWLRRAGGIYRVVDEVPGRSPDELQEVPADEAARLARVPVRRP